MLMTRRLALSWLQKQGTRKYSEK